MKSRHADFFVAAALALAIAGLVAPGLSLAEGNQKNETGHFADFVRDSAGTRELGRSCVPEFLEKKPEIATIRTELSALKAMPRWSTAA